MMASSARSASINGEEAASSRSNSSSSMSSASSLCSADLSDASGHAEYNFSKHAARKLLLDDFVAREGRHALEPCDRLSTEIVGLHNQGATCYLNSLLQTLFFNKAFREGIYGWRQPFTEDDLQSDGDEKDSVGKDDKDTSDADEAKCIPLQMQRLFARLQFAEEAAVTTTALTKSFGWSDADAFEQQDVQELARVLFDSLEQAQDGKELTEPFKGSLVDYIRCLKCSHRRARREEFQDLSLVIQNAHSVTEALEGFVEVERLEGDNQYSCEHCGEKTDAVKGHRLVTLPSTLVLHLKRFEFDWESGRRSKVDDALEIPLHLDVGDLLGLDDEKDAAATGERDEGNSSPGAEDSISDSLCEDLLACKALARQTPSAHVDPAAQETTGDDPTGYTLSAIIVHQGNANSGHYYAVARTGPRTWHEFNDTFVATLDEDDVERMCRAGGSLAEGGAYMLFYTRANDDGAQALAKTVLPPGDLIEWVQQRNELRSQLRQVRAMDSQLVRIRVIASAAVDSSHHAIPDMPASTVLTVHGRKATPADVKSRAYNQLVPPHARDSCPLVRCRLRRVRENLHRVGAVMDADENLSLDELGIVGQATLLLEFCAPWTSAARNSSEIDDGSDQVQVRLFMWDDNLCQPLPLRAGRAAQGNLCTEKSYSFHTCWLPINVPRKATILDAREQLAAVLDMDAADLGILRTRDLLQDKTRTDCPSVEVLTENNAVCWGDLFRGGDGVLITHESQQSAEAVAQAYDEAMSYLEVSFNDPRLNSRGEPVSYPHSVRVKRDLSLAALKEKLLLAVGDDLDPDSFHIRSAAKAPQIKNMQQTVEEAGFYDHSVVHLGKGKPIPAGKILMRVFMRNSTEVAARIYVPERALVDDVRAVIAEEMHASDVTIFDRSPRGDEGDELHDGRPMRRLTDGRSVFVDLARDDLEEVARKSKAAEATPGPKVEEEYVPTSTAAGNAETLETLSQSTVAPTSEMIDNATTSNGTAGKVLARVPDGANPAVGARHWQLDSDGVENFNEPGLRSGGPSLQRVPSLDLASLPPVNERTSYQDEFMAKKGEWSESWRAAADAEAAGMVSEDDDATDAEQGPPAETMTPQEEPFVSGRRVLAKAPHWKRFFPGTIFSHCEQTDTFAVDFDDGDRLESVTREFLRAHAQPPAVAPPASAEAVQGVPSAVEPQQEPQGDDSPGHGPGGVRGLEESDNLCPEDKKSRRREKVATRDFRLQLLHMDTPETLPKARPNNAVLEPAPAGHKKATRAQSSPSRSRTRVYLSDGQSRQKRVQSSKLSRPKTLEPLAARPQAAVPAMPRDPLDVAPQSRIPRLAALRPTSKPSRTDPIASPRTPFKHSARVLRDARQEISSRETQASSSQPSSLPPLE